MVLPSAPAGAAADDAVPDGGTTAADHAAVLFFTGVDAPSGAPAPAEDEHGFAATEPPVRRAAGGAAAGTSGGTTAGAVAGATGGETTFSPGIPGGSGCSTPPGMGGVRSGVGFAALGRKPLGDEGCLGDEARGFLGTAFTAAPTPTLKDFGDAGFGETGREALGDPSREELLRGSGLSGFEDPRWRKASPVCADCAVCGAGACSFADVGPPSPSDSVFPSSHDVNRLAKPPDFGAAAAALTEPPETTGGGIAETTLTTGAGIAAPTFVQETTGFSGMTSAGFSGMTNAGFSGICKTPLGDHRPFSPFCRALDFPLDRLRAQSERLPARERGDWAKFFAPAGNPPVPTGGSPNVFTAVDGPGVSSSDTGEAGLGSYMFTGGPSFSR